MARSGGTLFSMPGAVFSASTRGLPPDSPPAARRAFATTPAFRVKALHLAGLERFGNRAPSLSPRIDPDRDLGIETHHIAIGVWLEALSELGRLAGGELPPLEPHLLAPTNLGIWSSLLRGATHAEQVYRRLAQPGDGLGLWEEVSALPGCFRAAVNLPPLDEARRRLVAAALAAELRVVPELFGEPRAQVAVVERHARRLVFEARYRAETKQAPLTLLGAVGAGATTAGIGLTLGGQPTLVALSSAIAATIAGLGAALFTGEARHRRTRRSQHLRIGALEREMQLQDERASDFGDGDLAPAPVIAGAYRLGRQLGFGASGAVWEAERIDDGARVALKLLRTAVAGEGRAADRLQREAEVLGLAWHPNVVALLDHGLLPDGLCFLVLERLDGETLDARVRRLGRLSAREVIRWGVEATEALRAVHAAGIVHRDIKPANLFIHRDGSGETLKLCDFGIAKVDWAETRLTRDGVPLGTRGYAAPEQELGEPVDARADLYALGQSLRELLTGCPPPGAHSRSRPETREAEPTESGAHPLSDRSSQLLAIFDHFTADRPSDRPSDAATARRLLETGAAAAGIERTGASTGEGEPPASVDLAPEPAPGAGRVA